MTYLGLAFIYQYNKKIYIVMPKEILKRFNHNKYKDQIKTNTSVYNIAISMINYYGPVSSDFFIDTCVDKYGINPRSVNMDSLLLVARSLNVTIFGYGDSEYLFFGRYHGDDTKFVFYSDVYKERDYDLFNIKYKDVDKDELLKYRDLDYVEKNIYTNELYNYLKNINVDNPDEVISTLIPELRDISLNNYMFFTEMLDDCNVDEKYYGDIFDLVINIVANIPLRGNRGWSNRELATGVALED